MEKKLDVEFSAKVKSLLNIANEKMFDIRYEKVHESNFIIYITKCKIKSLFFHLSN